MENVTSHPGSLIINKIILRMISKDPYLTPYEGLLRERLLAVVNTARRLTQNKNSLLDFAAAHEYFGLHQIEGEWVFREWAPNATHLFLIGDFSQWREDVRFALNRISSDGIWEIHFPLDTLKHLDLYRLRIHWPNGKGDRIPVYARRLHQDSDSLIFNAQVHQPASLYLWQNDSPPPALSAHLRSACWYGPGKRRNRYLPGIR